MQRYTFSTTWQNNSSYPKENLYLCKKITLKDFLEVLGKVRDNWKPIVRLKSFSDETTDYYIDADGGDGGDGMHQPHRRQEGLEGRQRDVQLQL